MSIDVQDLADLVASLSKLAREDGPSTLDWAEELDVRIRVLMGNGEWSGLSSAAQGWVVLVYRVLCEQLPIGDESTADTWFDESAVGRAIRDHASEIARDIRGDAR